MNAAHSPPPSQNSTPLNESVRFGSSPQRVLVTGGTGFIGRVLVGRLAAQGHSVTILTRNAQSASSRMANVGFAGSLDKLPQRAEFDVVVNLAGARILGIPWTTNRRAVLMESRAGLTKRLVSWMGKQPSRPWLMLSASAIGYYGIQRQNDTVPLTEDAPPQDIFMSRLCSDWEQAARAATLLGVEVRCTRFGVVLGHGGALPQLMLPIKLGIGGKLGTGRQWMSWIHIDDLIGGLAHVWNEAARTRPPAGSGGASFEAFNFTTPGAVTQADFARVATRVSHRPCWLPTPAKPVRLLLGEQADLILEGQRVFPARLIQTGFKFAYPELKRALESLA